MTNYFDAAFEVKALDRDGEFSGLASVFDVRDYHDEVVAPGAFSRSLAEWKLKDRLPSMLWQHDAREPIGVFRSMKETDRGLQVEGQLLIDDIPRARQARTLLREKAIDGMSIGFITRESSRDERTGVRTIEDVDLMEVSLVTFAANPQAVVDQVKHYLPSLTPDQRRDIADAVAEGGDPTTRRIERSLREAGLSRAQAKAVIAGGVKALETERDAGDGADLAAQIAAFCQSVQELRA